MRLGPNREDDVPRSRELVRRPLEMADLLLVEANERSLHGEIEEVFAVDRGELLRSELRRHVLDRIRRRRTRVAPAGKRHEQRWLQKLGPKFDRQGVHTVKIGEAGADVNA